MGLARGSTPFILVPFGLSLLALAPFLFLTWAASGITAPWFDVARWLLFCVSTLLCALAAFSVWFFRDPERTPADGIVSPADGKVLFVEPYEDPELGAGHRVAIFMSPLDVHVNRAPVSGTLTHLEHRPGGYLPAFNKESERNERVITDWVADGTDVDGLAAGQRVRMAQIAGAVARRIVPWTQVDESRARGERMGMIRFGSRVDVYLPAGCRIDVGPGERVFAAQTRLARGPIDTD